jgi:cation transport ATPase
VNERPSPTAGADLLTRTTLQIDGVLHEPMLAQAARALRRVPGVLLAEIDLATGRAVIAHDDAVTMDSLLAAASFAGLRAEVVTEGRTTVNLSGVTLQRRQRRIRRIVSIAIAAFAVSAILNIVYPNNADIHWLLPLIMSLLWILYFTMAALERRRSQ